MSGDLLYIILPYAGDMDGAIKPISISFEGTEKL